MRQRINIVLVLLTFIVATTAALADGHGGSAGTELKGTVTALPSGTLVGDWTIATRTVHVSKTTKIEQEGGAPAVGSSAEVKGSTQADGSIDAASLEVKSPPPGGPAAQETHFIGGIEGLPTPTLIGDWKVGGKTVHVSALTKIEMEHGAPAVGATVEVEGALLADGSIAATSLEVRGAAPGGGVPPEIADAPQSEVRGAVEALSAKPGFLGDWKVSGVTIHVSATTRIRTEDRTLAVGAFVEVKGTRLADASIDAARIELLWGPATSGGAKTAVSFIPSVAHAAGRNGAFFTTSVTLANTAAVPVEIEVRFHGHDKDGREHQVRALTLGAQETRTIDDVLGTLFGAASDFGMLAIASNSGALIVSTRTGTPGAAGSFGQDVPAASREDLVREGTGRLIAGVRQNAAVRTNLVLANTGEMETDVEIELDGADGSSLDSVRIRLHPLEMRQINDVARALGAPDGFRDGRLRLSTPTANGAFAAFASEIDNGTNDPRTLWPR